MRKTADYQQLIAKGDNSLSSHVTEALQAWLNLRFDPEFIIMAAVDYALYNLNPLQAAGYNVEALNDAEKAKIFYLTHHLGLSDAKRFIRNAITEKRARQLLIGQVRPERAAKFAEDHGGYIDGHRFWLFEYINSSIIVDNFYCPKGKADAKKKPSTLKYIIEKL